MCECLQYTATGLLFHLFSSGYNSILKTDAKYLSVTFLPFYQSAPRNIPQDGSLNTHCHYNRTDPPYIQLYTEGVVIRVPLNNFRVGHPFTMFEN